MTDFPSPTLDMLSNRDLSCGSSFKGYRVLCEQLLRRPKNRVYSQNGSLQ